MPELPAAALFREYALRKLRAAARVSALARHRHGAPGRWRWLARARGAEGALPLLRQYRAQCLQLALAVRSPRAFLRGVPPQSHDSRSFGAAKSRALAKDRARQASTLLHASQAALAPHHQDRG